MATPVCIHSRPLPSVYRNPPPMPLYLYPPSAVPSSAVLTNSLAIPIPTILIPGIPHQSSFLYYPNPLRIRAFFTTMLFSSRWYRVLLGRLQLSTPVLGSAMVSVPAATNRRRQTETSAAATTITTSIATRRPPIALSIVVLTDRIRRKRNHHSLLTALTLMPVLISIRDP